MKKKITSRSRGKSAKKKSTARKGAKRDATAKRKAKTRRPLARKSAEGEWSGRLGTAIPRESPRQTLESVDYPGDNFESEEIDESIEGDLSEREAS